MLELLERPGASGEQVADALAMSESRNFEPWRLPHRVRYNYVCLLTDLERFDEAFVELAAIAPNPEMAHNARTDPALKPLRDHDSSRWKALFLPSDLGEISLIGKEWTSQLEGAGVKSVAELAAASQDRLALISAKVGAPASLVGLWHNVCRLSLMPEAGARGANLLADTGTTSLPELAKQDKDALTKLLAAVNTATKRFDDAPPTDVIEGWITYAKAASAS